MAATAEPASAAIFMKRAKPSTTKEPESVGPSKLPVKTARIAAAITTSEAAFTVGAERSPE